MVIGIGSDTADKDEIDDENTTTNRKFPTEGVVRNSTNSTIKKYRVQTLFSVKTQESIYLSE